MTRTVLVLEDSRTQAMIIRKMFERAGFSCLLAFDHDSAIDILKSQGVDLLILDVFVESSNSLDHLDQFRHLAPDVPIGIMTAGNSRDPEAGSSALNSARRARVDFLLPKPFLFEDVKQICEDVERRTAA